MLKGRPDINRWLALSIMLSVLIQGAGILALEAIGPYDSTEYLSISGNLFSGKGYAVAGTRFKGFETFQGEIPTRMRQPGYPLYLVVFYWAFGKNVIVTQISQVLLSVLTLCLVFRISRVTFGQDLWGGTLVALGLYFPLWLNSAYVATEILFTFLLALFMYALLKAITAKEPDVLKFFLTGTLAGIAFLTRPVAIFLALTSLVPIAAYMRNSRKTLLMWGVLNLAFFTTLLPWTLRNELVLGDLTFLSTEGGYNLWVASVGEEPRWHDSAEVQYAVQDGYYLDREANSRFISLAIGHIERDPFGYFARSIKRAAWVWSYFPGSQNFRGRQLVFGLFTAIQLLILLCAAFGMICNEGKMVRYYLLPAIGLSCTLLFSKAISRFIVPAMPFVLVLSGQGFWWLWNRIQRKTAGTAAEPTCG